MGGGGVPVAFPMIGYRCMTMRVLIRFFLRLEELRYRVNKRHPSDVYIQINTHKQEYRYAYWYIEVSEKEKDS